MPVAQANPVLKVFLLISSVVSLSAVSFGLVGPINTYAQTSEKVRQLPADFISEQGCPVTLTGSRTELDLDPFDGALDARLYFDYTNSSDRAIAAVKFRVRFVDDSGKDVGTFQASDAAAVQPGEAHSQKWRTDRVYKGSASVKIRVLLVRFADGTLWQSAHQPPPDEPR